MPTPAFPTILRVAVLLALLLPSTLHASPRGGEPPAEDRLLAEGWSLVSSGRLGEARERLAPLRRDDYLLGDYAIYLDGLARSRSGDGEGAAAAVAALEARPGGSDLLPPLALDAAFRRALSGDLEGAASLFGKARGKVSGNGRKAAEGFLAARLLEGEDPAGAAEGHLSTFSAWPSREGGQASMDRLLAAYDRGEFVRLRMTRRFHATLARALGKAGEEGRARSLYREALRRFPLDDEAWPVVLDFAETLRKGGDVKGARALLLLLEGAPPAVRGEAAFLRARVEWRAGRLPDARGVFLAVAADNVARDTAERAAYLAAWIAEEEGEPRLASDGYGTLADAADPSIRAEARFRRGWLLLTDGKAAEAEALLAAGEAEGDRVSPVEGARYRYWRGRALAEAGRKAEAEELFRALAADPGAGPYALVARIPLGLSPYDLLSVPARGGDGEPFRAERERLWERIRSAPWEPRDALPVERAARLAAVGMAEYAAAEAERVDRGALRRALGSEAGGGALFRWLAGDLKGAMAEVERNGSLPGELAERIRYPLSVEWIGPPDRPVSGLDPLLLHALVRQESRFQPDALSPAGAVGLMQLMPKTARETARKAGRRSPERWELADPSLNVALGSRYLAGLVERFGGEYFHALAAYNGGESATDRWLERSAGDPARFLETIGYRETRLYVRKVVLNLLQYFRIYRPEALARTAPTPPPPAPPPPGGGGTPASAAAGGATPAGATGTPAP